MQVPLNYYTWSWALPWGPWTLLLPVAPRILLLALSKVRLWLPGTLSRAPPILRAILQQCETMITMVTSPIGPRRVAGQQASCQEEWLLPGPGSRCWLPLLQEGAVPHPHSQMDRRGK